MALWSPTSKDVYMPYPKFPLHFYQVFKLSKVISSIPEYEILKRVETDAECFERAEK